MTKFALRNSLREHISTVYKGNKKWFRSKQVRIFDDTIKDEQEEMRHWLKVYGGLIYIDGNVKVVDKDEKDSLT